MEELCSGCCCINPLSPASQSSQVPWTPPPRSMQTGGRWLQSLSGTYRKTNCIGQGCMVWTQWIYTWHRLTWASLHGCLLVWWSETQSPLCTLTTCPFLDSKFSCPETPMIYFPNDDTILCTILHQVKRARHGLLVLCSRKKLQSSLLKAWSWGMQMTR